MLHDLLIQRFSRNDDEPRRLVGSGFELDAGFVRGVGEDCGVVLRDWGAGGGGGRANEGRAGEGVDLLGERWGRGSSTARLILRTAPLSCRMKEREGRATYKGVPPTRNLLEGFLALLGDHEVVEMTPSERLDVTLHHALLRWPVSLAANDLDRHELARGGGHDLFSLALLVGRFDELVFGREVDPAST
jgi:hypothetical protein